MKKLPTIILTLTFPLLLAAEKPLLKAGIMSDTHINEKRSSFHLVEKALKLFKDHKVDLVIHLGDFADVHCPGGYRLYRQIFNEIFTVSRPRELFVYDGHDAARHPDMAQAFKAMQKNLGNVNPPYWQEKIKGYTFLVYPYKADLKRQEKEMTRAVAQAQGRPVFVLDHHPPFDTTAVSRLWGNRPRRRLAEKFPQVIRLSGHSHGTLWNERNIWQGKFTTVNAGCLQYWPGMLPGNIPQQKTPEEVMVMEVYANRILFRCFSVTDKQEIRAASPWCVPWPFDEKTAPYSDKNRFKTMPAVQFPAGAELEMTFQGTPCREVRFTFPEAADIRNCYIYKTELFCDGQRIARKDYHSSFYKKVPDKEIHASWNSGFFTPGKTYRMSVSPVNFAGKTGRSLEKTFTVPEVEKGEVTFECSDPLLPGCRVLTGLRGGKVLRKHKDFFRHPGGDVRLEFPAGVWQGKAGTRFRLVLDIETIQQENCQWTMRLRCPRPAWSAQYRMWTLPGRQKKLRYVFDFRKKSDQGELYLHITESAWGRFKVHFVKIERFLP